MRLASPDCDETTVPLLIAKESAWATAMDTVGKFAWGAISGEGDDLAAMTGDLVLGSLPVVGVLVDVRDVAKELARLAPGGDEANVYVAGFALLGIITELPWFKGGPDQVIGLIKVLMKQLNPARPLTKALLTLSKRALADPSLATESLPLIQKLIDNPSFRQLTESSLVEGAGDLDNLISMTGRVGDVEAERVLLGLSSESGVGPEDLRRVTDLFGGQLDAAAMTSLSTGSKVGTVARAVARSNWNERAVERYLLNVERFGADSDVIRHLDEVAHIPGSGVYALKGGGDLGRKGPQFELDVASALGIDNVRRFDISPSGASTADVDILTDGLAIQAKHTIPRITSSGRIKMDKLVALRRYADANGLTAVLAMPVEQRGRANQDFFDTAARLGIEVRWYEVRIPGLPN